MDNLRIFTTFQTTSKSFKKAPKVNKNSLPLDKNGMITRNKDEKPHVSRQEVLEKLKKAKGPEVMKAKANSGQKFGVGFLGEEESAGDIKKNNPNNPMTTEKLKSMLNSGAVNFNGKEQEVLRKILG